MPFRAVFFDLGGTLFRYSDIEDRLDGFLDRVLSRHTIEAPRDELRRAFGIAMVRTLANYRERSFYLHRDLFDEAHRTFLAQFGARPAPEEKSFASADGGLDLGPMTPRVGAAETLGVLRRSGLHLGVVSNIDDDQFHAVWSRLGLAESFHATTTSEEARSCKPDPGIYRLALEKAGAPDPEDAVFVGDSREHDVAGARALGMTTALITDASGASALAEPRGSESPEDRSASPHHVIRELSELLGILGL